MKQRTLKLLPMIFILMILLLLPFDWYNQIVSDNENVLLKNAKGVYVFFNLNGMILFIFVYTLLIHFGDLIYSNYIFPIIGNIGLILALILFPSSTYPIKISGFLFLTRFYYGFYLALSFIICSILFDLILLFKKLKKP